MDDLQKGGRQTGSVSGGAAGPDPVQIRELPAEIAQLMVSRTVHQGLLQRADSTLAALPSTGMMAKLDDAMVASVQPLQWLVIRPGAQGDLVEAIRGRFGDAAAVVDQSCGRSVFVVSGARSRDMLAKCCRLDLSDKSFPMGAALSTMIAHVNVLVLRPDGDDRFMLLVGSTFAQWLVESLIAASDEFGWSLSPGTSVPASRLSAGALS